jgi:hypothetical protein
MTTPAPAVNSSALRESPKALATKALVSFQLEDGKLVETVLKDNGLWLYTQGTGFERSRIFQGKKVEPHPILSAYVEHNTLVLPSKPVKYESTSVLLVEIQQFIKRYAVVEEEEWVNVISHYVLMTWVYDRFQAVPYLRFLGDSGTGKTRILEVIHALSYKGIKVSGNITGAGLFRLIEIIRGTLAVDEADFKNSDDWSDITKILNNGYAKGMPIFRCHKENNDPEPYTVFGPKLLSTRNRFADDATETRCLTLETKTVRVPKHIPLQLPPAFHDEAQVLQNKLLQWRFDNFQTTHAIEDGLRDIVFVRTAQIGSSLMAVAPDDVRRGQLIAFLQRLDDAGKEGSLTAAIERALEKLAANSLGLTSNPTATVKNIADAVNEERSDQGLEPLSPKRVGGTLRSMGYKPKKTRDGNRIELPACERSPVNV